MRRKKSSSAVILRYVMQPAHSESRVIVAQVLKHSNSSQRNITEMCSFKIDDLNVIALAFSFVVLFYFLMLCVLTCFCVLSSLCSLGQTTQTTTLKH